MIQLFISGLPRPVEYFAVQRDPRLILLHGAEKVDTLVTRAETEGCERGVERCGARARQAEADELEVVRGVPGGLGEVAVVRGRDAEETVKRFRDGRYGGPRRKQARSGK